MKTVAALIAASLLLFAGILASSTHAQEAPLDLGEPDALVEACNSLVPVGASNGLQIRNCRIGGAYEVTGNVAKVRVRIATDHGPYLLDVTLTKSLWHVDSLDQVSP